MIWLASFPRSGNTFFRNVLYEVYGIESATYHLDPDRTLDPAYDRFPVIKTHLLPGQLPAELRHRPAVYLIRDGRDALVSLAHHRKDIVAPGTDFYNNLLEATLAQEGSFFGGWSENVRQWTERAAIVIRFADLIRDPLRETEKLRAVMPLPAPVRQRVPTFQQLRHGKPRYGAGQQQNFDSLLLQKNFRRGKVGGWKSEVSPEILNLIYRIHGDTLRRFGYEDVPPPVSRPSRNIMIEAAKLRTGDNDGVKRYLTGLRHGLSILLPHFPHLKIYYFSGYTGSVIGEPQEKSETQFRSLSQLEVVLVDDRKMAYEKLLLLIKLSVSSLLPQAMYRAISTHYRRGPFRQLLARLRTKVLRTRNRVSDRQLANILHEANLVHIPLPQHFGQSYAPSTPALVTVHDLSHRLFPHFHEQVNIRHTEAGLQAAISNGAHLLAVSAATSQDLIQLYELSPQKVQLISEAPDRSLMNRKNASADFSRTRFKYNIPPEPYLLCLSTIEPRKNLRATVRSFINLKSAHPRLQVNLVIAGKHGWKTEDIFTGLDFERPDIIFTGFVDDVDLPPLYGHARALCYVSYYEGFGLPIVESMACGTPVICGNNSSQPEVAGAGGILVDAEDIEGIAEAMLRLLTDQEFHRAKAEAAWRQANKFSWLKTALLTLDLYERLTEPKP